jgi:cell division protein FtsL
MAEKKKLKKNVKKAGTRKPKKPKKAEVARERQPKGLHFGFLFLVFFFLAATGVFMLAQHHYTVRNDIASRKLQSQIDVEKSKQESLRLRLAALKSPGRVARIATDELGLSEPGGVIYLRYSKDAAGNMVCQSTYEELQVSEPRKASTDQENSPAATTEQNAVQQNGAGARGR